MIERATEHVMNGPSDQAGQVDRTVQTVQTARPARTTPAQLAWAAGGFVAFGLGALGAALPVLPTAPFLLVAAFCFARSSERLNEWFRSTRLYRTVLADYVQKRSMTPRAKALLLGSVTAVLGISFVAMGSVPVGRAVVAAVWLAHVVYFGFVVRTEAAGEKPAGEKPTPAGDPLAPARGAAQPE